APEDVHAAFRDVASAQEDKILIMDRATTFAQEGVNLAEGDAVAMVESARAFRDQKILEAEGDAYAFTRRDKEYRRAPDLTRFGRVARVITEPGLRIKRPYPFETVTRLDRRLLTFKPATAEYLSQDKKNLVIHSLVTWRIADPERFLATVGTRATAQERLADV